jgi:multicomponent Na+:H+ antiporter subunit D
VLTLASALTGGAVIRMAGRVFMGWGPADPPDTPEAEEARADEAETLKPHDRTPPLMVIPAVALMAGAFVVGLVPGFVHAVEHAATRFREGSAYAAAVFHPPGHFHELPPSHLHASDFVYGSLSLLGALAVAGLGLFGRRLPERLTSGPTAVIAKVLAGLRDLQSGHVGDYVTWLVVTLAVLGGTFALTLR